MDFFDWRESEILNWFKVVLNWFNEISKKYKEFINALASLGTIALAIFTIILVYFIYHELTEFRKQTVITEKSFRQSYRPIGTIETKKAPFDSVVVDSTFNARDDRYIVNKGNGVLLYIGFYRLITNIKINFWSKSLIENMKEMNISFEYENFDTRHEERRLIPITNGEKELFTIFFVNLPLITKYYLYSIFWYKDQENNLYETIHLDFVEYLGIAEQDSSQSFNVIPNDFFHDYTIDEHNELYEMISLSGHPIAEFIGKR